MVMSVATMLCKSENVGLNTSSIHTYHGDFLTVN